jgi:DNA repair exonuclease SbcCD nuclease subunit
VFLLGNHDMFYEDKWDVHSLTPLQEWATVIDEPCMLELSGTPVDFLPYTPHPTKHLKVWQKHSDVLISHLAISEALLNVKYNILSVEDDSKEKEVIKTEVFAKWKKTWLGHYHYGQKLGHNVEYIGSPMQLTYGEAGQKKHVAVFDLETLETEYVENTLSPQFHIIVDPLQVERLDVNNSYVKFRCGENIESKFAFRKQLSKLGAREIEFESPPKDVVEVAGKALLNIAALFADKPKLITEFLKTVEIPAGLDAALLEKVGIEFVS